jgi:hypothetical protein
VGYFFLNNCFTVVEYGFAKKARYVRSKPARIPMGSPSGARKALTKTMLVTIGANITRAKGTNIPVSNKEPQRISVILRNGIKYPVAIRPLLKACNFSGKFVGAGIKFKSPIQPKMKNIKPSKIRAISGNFAFMVSLL